MSKIKFIVILSCFGLSSLFALATTPAGAIKDMANLQEESSKSLINQKIEFEKIVALIKKTYISNAYMVFLATQRNRLIYNSIKLESWE